MSDMRSLLKEAVGDIRPTPNAFDQTKNRVHRRERNRRIAAGSLAVAVFAAAAVYAWPAFHAGEAPPPATTATVPATIDAHVAATIPVGGYAEDLAVGEGAVWVSIPAQDPSTPDLVVRIDSETDQVVAEVPVSGPIAELVAGGGAVWGSISEKSGFSIVRIDPATNRVVATIPDVGGPLAFGEGALWGSALEGNAASLIRIDPSTNQIVARIRLETRIWYAETGGGSVWILTLESLFGPENEEAPTGDIIKVDPATNSIARRIEMSFKGTLDAPVFGDGALWVPVCCTGSSLTLVRVDPDTDQEIAPPISRTEGTPFAVDMGRLMLMGESGTLYALNTQTLEEERLVTSDWPANHTTTELDLTTDSVWVANAAPLKTVTRIDLEPVGSPSINKSLQPSCTRTFEAVQGPVSDPRGAVLSSAVALSSDDVWAVGGSGGRYSHHLTSTLVEHWDGSSWSIVPGADPGSELNELRDISATGPNDIWAVGFSSDGGDAETLIEHWDGASWLAVGSPNPGAGGNFLSGVVAISVDDAWAVGASGDVDHGTGVTLVVHWDGSSWTVVPNPHPGEIGERFFDVAGVSADGIWAVGYEISTDQQSAPLVERWDGLRWSVEDLGLPSSSGSLHGVGVVSTDEVWAAGPPVFRWDGSAWTRQLDPTEDPDDILGSVDGSSATDVWTTVQVPGVEGVGSESQIAHWDGVSWTIAQTIEPNSYLSGVSISPEGSVWVVGSQTLGGGIPEPVVQLGSCSGQ